MYRIFEIIPALLSWGTIVAVVFLSWAMPAGIAVFIIIFDLYWLIKTIYLSLHLRENGKRLKRYQAMDWEARLANMKWDHVRQLIILPFYREGWGVVDATLRALANSKWPRERLMVVLACEERARDVAEAIARRAEEKYGAEFAHFLVTWHPAGLKGEIAGKGSNITWAAREAQKIMDAEKIPYENILVSAFDIDTQVDPQYFLCLAYHFLTAEKPHRSSYQPVPLYNNNIWFSPAASRVVATSGTFWQMMQQERPERLSTFSSHSMSFRMLADVGFWQTNVVSEDSRIFWNALLHYDGDYRVVPLSFPVSMDANVGRNFFETAIQVYKQQRRWTWGVENVPYLLYGFWKNKTIPFRTKVFHIATQLEGFWGLSTNPILIFLLGWFPLMVGGSEFNATLLSYNLPRITRLLMTAAMFGLITSAIVSTRLLPPRPSGLGRWRWGGMVLQWVLIPVTIVVFGAFPGLDAQLRLALGRPLGFWVTPKRR
ncbi:MAG: glycosyltransferase family 2 protein [Candidatus Niyogibacteria bacterium]|nr:glycosyltransferase family 2 protein [Candidatus Niyogibacteria bacterium]